MEKRPLSQSLRQWLLDEIELWRRDGLVTEEQANAILDRYETSRQSSARQQSIAIYVLVGVAALFVGLAVFMLIGYNWDAFSNPIKLMLLLGSVGGTYALGFVVRYVWNAKIFSEFAFFLGCLFYGGAMMLIAEIFHLQTHLPDGLWWWAVGVIPLALFLDTLLLHLLAVTLLAVWVGTEMFGRFGEDDFGLFGLLPRACFTLPIFAALGLLWAYHKKIADHGGPLRSARWVVARLAAVGLARRRESDLLHRQRRGALADSRGGPCRGEPIRGSLSAVRRLAVHGSPERLELS
jgi:hypothetical protein